MLDITLEIIDKAVHWSSLGPPYTVINVWFEKDADSVPYSIGKMDISEIVKFDKEKKNG